MTARHRFEEAVAAYFQREGLLEGSEANVAADIAELIRWNVPEEHPPLTAYKEGERVLAMNRNMDFVEGKITLIDRGSHNLHVSFLDDISHPITIASHRRVKKIQTV